MPTARRWRFLRCWLFFYRYMTNNNLVNIKKENEQKIQMLKNAIDEGEKNVVINNFNPAAFLQS